MPVGIGREPISAPEGEKEDLERLSALLRDRGSGWIRVRLSGGAEQELPHSAVEALRAVVETLASGDAMALVRVERELTSQQAADMLNVSRQYVARLADTGQLQAATTTGGHRRFRLADVLAYKASWARWAHTGG